MGDFYELVLHNTSAGIPDLALSYLSCRAMLAARESGKCCLSQEKEAPSLICSLVHVAHAATINTTSKTPIYST